VTGMESNQKQCDVLIIEDDPSTVELLIDFFKIKGYNCQGVNSGQKGLKKLTNILPKLILIDIILPDIDGYEVCKTIRGNIKYKDVIIIYITAKSKEEIIEKLEETGANGFLLKPFELPKVELLEQYLK
jgi:CheY-like chemotaxis protein